MYTYKFTQNDFPFPYNKSDIWKDGCSIGWAVRNESGKSTNGFDFYSFAHEQAMWCILQDDNGAILNALETTKHNLSQDEVDDIITRYKLAKENHS